MTSQYEDESQTKTKKKEKQKNVKKKEKKKSEKREKRRTEIVTNIKGRDFFFARLLFSLSHKDLCLFRWVRFRFTFVLILFGFRFAFEAHKSHISYFSGSQDERRTAKKKNAHKTHSTATPNFSPKCDGKRRFLAFCFLRFHLAKEKPISFQSETFSASFSCSFLSCANVFEAYFLHSFHWFFFLAAHLTTNFFRFLVIFFSLRWQPWYMLICNK